MQIKQIDVCELNGILVFLTTSPNSSESFGVDTGSAGGTSASGGIQSGSGSGGGSGSSGGFGGGRICIFNLNELNVNNNESNSDDTATSHVLNKASCKERRVDFISACHLYALSNPLLNKHLKVVAACGKKLAILNLKTAASSATMGATSCIANLNNAANQIAVNPIIGLSASTGNAAASTSNASTLLESPTRNNYSINHTSFYLKRVSTNICF